MVVQSDTTAWLAEQTVHGTMFRHHREYLLKNWDLWRRERDVVGANARLCEVCTPNALEVLMTVLRRVSSWSCGLLLRRLGTTGSTAIPTGTG